MSTRPAARSIRGVAEAATPPCRMKVPSCTLRTRNTFGLNVIVSVIIDRRLTLPMEIGTVYGPPLTRNSVPGGVTITCAGGADGADGVGAGGAFGSRGGAVGSAGTSAG